MNSHFVSSFATSTKHAIVDNIINTETSNTLSEDTFKITDKTNSGSSTLYVESQKNSEQTAIEKLSKILSKLNYDININGGDFLDQRALANWLIYYKKSGFNILLDKMSNEIKNPRIISELLIALGKIESSDFLAEQLQLINSYLLSRDPIIRYGAIISSSYLDKPQLLSSLSQALQRESIPTLKNIIQSVIVQLNDTEGQ